MRYGEMTAFEERPHSPVLRLRRRDAAVTSSCSTSTSAGPATASSCASSSTRRAPRSPGSTSTPTCRATATLLPAAQRGDRAREPVLEGLVGLDLLPRRRAAGLPAGDLRAAGLRLRRQDARRAARPARLERPGVRRPAREAGGRPQAPLQPRLLGRGRRVLRARARRRRAQVDALDLQHRPPALERHRRQVEGEGRRAPPHRARACSPAGACARWPRARAATTRSATTSARSGRSTTRSSPGACAATASRTRRRGSPPGILEAAEFFDGRLPEAFGGYQRDADEVPGPVPDRVQPAGVVDRRAAAAACARCSGSSRSGDHLVVDPALASGDRPPRAARHPRAVGPLDAFGPRPGRGRRPRGRPCAPKDDLKEGLTADHRLQTRAVPVWHRSRSSVFPRGAGRVGEVGAGQSPARPR